ncbi:HEPN domain-containing protein [Pseudomonas monteilii]|uniref:ApeA N-terminal domain 1-containing protein n=1 Tax=Pseudomonas monteilii TaxID=76759 RepID=UPI0013768A07|nr:HEPN domain-containing protein [Pseudomonas monteilii]NBB07419.1 hypothetical protein [Pseudomonas monteilii]
MRIEEEYLRSGFFWIPGEEHSKIPGKLSVTDGGVIELEIIGHFNNDISSIQDYKLPRIVGDVEKDGLVTLDNCFYKNKNIAFGGVSKSIVAVNKMLAGAAWDIDEPITFNTFHFSIDCLEEWVGISGIKINTDHINKRSTIVYQSPENITLPLDNGMTLEICFSSRLPAQANTAEATISQKVYFKLISPKLIELDQFTTAAFKITNLMCFATDEIVSLKHVSATSTDLQELIEDQRYPAPISLYYQSHPFSIKKPKKNWREMLFCFTSIHSNAQQVFNNWFNAYEYLEPAINLYFSTKTGGHKYLEGKFLALAQGLETYHRRTSNTTLMNPEIFEKVTSQILESCPECHRDWLEGRIKHGNEVNLGKRLKSIIEPFKDHLGTSAKRSKMLRQIVDTRNYLTHYSENLSDISATGTDLWNLCMKMEVIFKLHFLKVIGFTSDEISSIIENHYPMKYMLQEI